MARDKERVTAKKENTYVWLSNLPQALCGFANRAKILTGDLLKQDILDTYSRRKEDYHKTQDTLAELTKLVTYHTARLQEIDDELENCVEALSEYEEILSRDGKVEPAV